MITLSIAQDIVGWLWIIFILYWLGSSLTAKRTVRYNFKGFFIRILLAIVIFLAVNYHGFKSWGWLWSYQFTNPWIYGVGIIIVTAGIGLAIWARVHLGRNWGMPMTLKENPELVTSGPYKYIRHPIYTGGVVGMIGTGMVLGVWWFLVGISMFVYFAYSAKTEDKIMAEQFPNDYPAYKTRTKMMIPGVF